MRLPQVVQPDCLHPKLPIQPFQKPTHLLLVRFHSPTHTRLLPALRTRLRLLLCLLLLPLLLLLHQLRIRLHLRSRRLVRLPVQVALVSAWSGWLRLILVLAVLGVVARRGRLLAGCPWEAWGGHRAGAERRRVLRLPLRLRVVGRELRLSGRTAGDGGLPVELWLVRRWGGWWRSEGGVVVLLLLEWRWTASRWWRRWREGAGMSSLHWSLWGAWKLLLGRPGEVGLLRCRLLRRLVVGRDICVLLLWHRVVFGGVCEASAISVVDGRRRLFAIDNLLRSGGGSRIVCHWPSLLCWRRR